MRKIVLAGLNECLGSAFSGLSDILSLARRAIVRAGAPAESASDPFIVVAASPDGEAVRDRSGASFPVAASFEAIETCDAIIVPSFSPDANGRPPDMSPFSATAAWLRRHHARGALIAGCGSGVFLLGEAGLLEGRRCTTSWRDYEELKQRYARVDAAWSARLIEDRRVVTAAGPFSWIDVALHVVRTLCGADAARVAAAFTVGEAAPAKGAHHGQNSYAATTLNAGASAFLADAERIVRQSDALMSAQELARALLTSERTLHRKLKQACGESPKTFIDRIRVETARTLLETSAKPVKELVASAGFADEASFRRAFRRFAGMAPSAYRIWARARSQNKGQLFTLQKDAEVVSKLLTTIFDACVNGVTLADPDLEDTPIIYANRPFTRITGYGLDEIIGRNCRFLQAEDRDQEGRQRLREAILNREQVEVTLRNYRKDGALFHNRLNITPLFDADGHLLYFLGVQYDVSNQVQAELEIGDLRAKLLSLTE
ncbi:helix-turn-helix domain-containing protein [Methylocystis sp. B8]|uniref:GlxA family transcriptional regulator n=1 Tax=Methylocystis sp. B8 TaxID=544938 RepID=UPI0010FE410D|nr:helix-turn-helix domain-containing protein [Methylocystis sp. B8]TLG73973.1 helix-turn-helix domain-containing protein [Methylocystis sp. B8]